MATYTVEDQVQQLYIGLLGRPADKEGFDYWVNDIKSGNISIEAVRSNFVNEQPEGQAIYDSGKSRTEIVNILYNNLFDRDPDANGLDYWVNGDGADITADLLVYALIQGAGDADRAVLDTAVQEANDAIDVEPGEEGENYFLTDGRDNITDATADNDTFYADAGQNQNGSIANAFATGDVLDGGAGRDKIVASIMEDQEVDSGADSFINARTFNIEEAHFEAMSLGGNGGAQETVTVDAGRMDSVQEFWSDDSSANLVIDDVRLGTKLAVTKDITFGLRDVDVDAGLEAWFDTNSLTNEGNIASNSNLLIRAADVSTQTPDTPLANVSLEIGFTVNGQSVLIEVQSTDGTYAGLRDAIDTALADAGMGSLEVSLANPYNEVVVAGNTTSLPFTAQEILITDPNGGEFENITFDPNQIDSVPGGFLLAGTAEPQDPDVNTTLIESNLVLDNAGRGSTAGDVYIGGMSGSGKVVEKLNLTVDRSSKIDQLLTGFDRTGNTAFQEIEVTSGSNQGDVSIGFIGNTQNFDATGFTGENLSVTGLAGVDVNAWDIDPNADDEAYVYNTAASNDTINVTYSHDKAAEFNDYSLSISTGAGQDNVTLISVDTDSFNLPNQQDFSNVVINTGAGNDVVRTPGDGNVVISTGSGSDTVYTDNTGNKATWVFNAQNTNVNDLRGDVLQTNLLYKAQLTVTFSGANIGGGVLADGFGGTLDNAAVATDNGFESTVTIDTDGGYAGNERSINEAIMKAINEHPVLSKLVVAYEGADNTLVVSSLIDGLFDADDLRVDIAAADVDEFGNAEKTGLTDYLRTAAGDSTLTFTDAQLQTALNDGVTAAEGSGTGYDGNSVLGTTVAAGGVVATGNETTTGTAGADEEQTLTITADDADDGDESLTVTFGTDDAGNTANVVVDLSAIDPTDAAAVATAVAAALNADGTFSGLATAAAAAGVVTLTYDGSATTVNINTTVSAAAGGTVGPLAGAGADVTQGGAGSQQEVQTIDLGATSVGAGESLTFTVDGNNFVYTNTSGGALTGDALEADIVTNLTVTNYTVTNPGAGAGDLTITQNAGSEADIADITVTEGIVGAGTLTGSQSTAETDNVVNLGTGEDVVVLSTSDTANEVLVWTGYDNGHNTVVNFMDAANGSMDMVNFGAYLDGQTSASGSTQSTVAIAQGVDAANTFDANGVSYLTAFDFTAEANETWANLTDANLLAALQSSTDTYANVNSADVTLQSDVANLVGNVRDHVVLVENNLNAGEYKVFHVTSTQDGGANAETFTSAELVGIVDFGDSVTLADANLA